MNDPITSTNSGEEFFYARIFSVAFPSSEEGILVQDISPLLFHLELSKEHSE
jgi:hypothetical protein